MTQPKFAPITKDSTRRAMYRLDPPLPWYRVRPAELQRGPVKTGKNQAGRGAPGPDQGYAMLLAERFVDRLVLAKGEHSDDVMAGAVAIATRRAASYGRAPVSTDIELALSHFGYLAPASDKVVEARHVMFDGIAHDYWALRQLVDQVPVEEL